MTTPEHTTPQGHLAWRGAQPVGALDDLRAKARARFDALGWPTRKIEAWKYTSLKAVRDGAWVFDGEVDSKESLDACIDARRLPEAWAELVLVDGRVDAARSRLPEPVEGVALRSVDERLTEEGATALGSLAPWRDDAPVAFNTAWLQDGLWLDVAPGTSAPGPVHVIHVSTGNLSAAVRHVVRLGARASAEVVESWLGMEGSEGVVSAVVEMDVGEGARLEQVVDAPAGHDQKLLRTAYTRVSRDGSWRAVCAWTGGGLVRAEHHTTVAGEGAEVSLDAVVVLSGREHVDQHNVFTHAAPHGTSRMRSKAVAGGRARGIFDGTVVVREGAQKTDARQDSRNLLLSRHAEIDAKPRLEIYADDVACAHGATVGRLDEQARTYLRSRGIPDEQARRMLIEAFVADRLEMVSRESTRAWLVDGVQTRLASVLATASLEDLS